MRSTVLESTHRALGARLVPFAGWTMPVQYGGVLDEARVVRSAAGLFDLCHMGRIAVSGSGAEPFLQRLQTNDAAKIQPGRIRYALILDDEGRTQDDILVYREPSGDGFFVVVNAGNMVRDLAIMNRIAEGFDDVRIVDQTDELAMLALQGPAARTIMQRTTELPLSDLGYYAWVRGDVEGVDARISRTGYTGEDGFEIYLPRSSAVDVWNRILEVGVADGVQPCGLGARDILRLEAGMALYGHEIDETTTPLDIGLDFAIKYTHAFVGRPALERIIEAGGNPRRLIGLTTTSRRVPRQGYGLFSGDREIGQICSGGASPTLDTNIATGYVDREFAEPGTELEFAVRDKREPAVVVKLPFYKRER